MMPFLTNILEFITKGLINLVGKKFVDFLIEVFSDMTGKVLDETYKIINEIVCNVEKIGEYVAEHPETPVQVLAINLTEKYGLVIHSKDVEKIRKNKGEGKYALAYELIVERIQLEGKNINLETAKQAINLGIELAVNRFFGKKLI
jgi:hypothetical protein